ncbi:hypothetical protein BV898_07987 [Hypsibius exemplaris]|uniref:G-protein coupled receptors family 1 profile domain-containing protein n=1 Tax=Hypsibius exemplaris TaxID=2072580 RepID=A0A1W0WRM4_HYPEX|nr:hypothetical protein BV898_07987 [Hypsibius exemplaris]
MNRTDGAAEKWTVLPVFQLITALTGFIGNTFVIVAFAVNRSLWTPFNVYVINLVFANWALTVLQFPMDVISSLSEGKWSLGETACTYYILAEWYLQPLILNSHQAIAINRVWAIGFPISYRRFHSVRIAIGLCVGVWCYVLVGLAPGFLPDVLYNRVPLSANHTSCELNWRAQFSWAVAFQTIFLIWPQIFMVLAFGVIFVRQRMRQQSRAAWRSNEVRPSRVEEQQNGRQRNSESNRGSASKEQQGNILLLLLTISITICWSPNNIYFTGQYIWDYDSPDLFVVSFDLLFSCFITEEDATIKTGRSTT